MAASSTFNASSGAGYDQMMGRWSRRLAVPFLDFAGSKSGERVLDVGCGTGSLTARLVEKSGAKEIVGIDYAEPYIEHVSQAIRNPRVSFRVGDATALPFEDASFDRVLCLLVLQFIPEAAKAIAEMRRVARPGATVAAAVWDTRGGFVTNRMLFDTAAAIDPVAAAWRARLYTRPMSRPGELEAAWREAGLEQVEATQLMIRMEFVNFDDYWTPYTGSDGPIAAYVSSLDEAMRAKVREAVRAAYLDSEEDGPRSYAAIAWTVKGIAP